MLSPFFTSQGFPSAALCSALHATKTRNINDLVQCVRQDSDALLPKIVLQPRVGPLFMTALGRAIKRTIPLCAPLQRGNNTGVKAKRAVCMQHIRTGRIISAPSIAEFTRIAGLKRPAQFQFDDVFKGQKLTLHGWGLPEVLNQQLDLKDVFGNRYQGTVAELRKRLSGQTLNRLRRGQVVGSLAPATHDYGSILPVKTEVASEYLVKRKGRVYRGKTLDEVARQVGVSSGGVFSLAHGYRENVKGVTLHYVRTRQRRDPLAAKLETIA